MNLKIIQKDKCFTFDAKQAKDISVALNFNGEQPNLYGVEKATSEAYKDGGFTGDTREGGGCNFERITMVPHCNGTHTECIGHITHKRFSIRKQLSKSLFFASLITVIPEPALTSSDTYDPQKESDDFFISKRILKEALGSVSKNFLNALIIRTLPNDKSKLSRNYTAHKPAFFSIEAMNHIVDLGIEHLLIDLPSIDRNHDEGKLTSHHLFWKIKEGTHELNPYSRVESTITEMIYVENGVDDGSYLLNLQVAPFYSDAAPSRPLLYPLIKVSDQ